MQLVECILPVESKAERLNGLHIGLHQNNLKYQRKKTTITRVKAMRSVFGMLASTHTDSITNTQLLKQFF